MRRCGNITCAADEYRTGVCSGTFNGYQCNACDRLTVRRPIVLVHVAAPTATNVTHAIMRFVRRATIVLVPVAPTASCNAYGCVIDAEDGCASCVEQSFRISNSTCATCNPGYELRGNNCVAFACETGPDDNCRSCVDQNDRASNTTCATCNDGYYLESTSCLPYACDVGPNSGCASCVAQELRTSNTTCATCNDGYFCAMARVLAVAAT